MPNAHSQPTHGQSDGGQRPVIGPYDITFSLKPGASAEDAVYLHEQVKAHPYVIDSEMTVADFAGECDRLRAESSQLREALDEIVDDLSVPSRPPAWAAHALQVAQESLALGGSQAKGSE